MRGNLISFEGGDGTGKSTQIERLARRLTAAGRRVVHTREPGGTRLGEAIRALLQTSKEGEGMQPETELLLFAASRAELVRSVIQPALESGAIVLADRFLDSTTVYQGLARRLDPEEVAQVNAFALGGLRPDLTLLLDLEPHLARERLTARLAPGETPDRMESQPEAFHQAVRDGYLKIARAEPQRIRLVDASGAVDTVAQSIDSILEEHFHGLFAPSSV
ncbi:MAG TPA: dTMP kinase [Chthoniobacteraceae bacterium]|nr:dTMP kinase [Chthoniobacteraceae bacterium]